MEADPFPLGRTSLNLPEFAKKVAFNSAKNVNLLIEKSQTRFQSHRCDQLH